MTATRAIVEQYAEARTGIDAAARHAAIIALADGLAVMVAATGLEPSVRPFMAHALAMGQGPSTLTGESRKVSPTSAALANGALAHALDFEDTFEPGKIHPNASLIPAVIALAESEDASGEALLAGLVLGCDFACRLSLALDGDPAARGWYHPPVLSGLGATLGCCTLLSLDADATTNALGLFLSQFMLADELKRSPLSHLRAVREGLAARAAVEAALLARAGVVAVEQPLEGQSGLFRLLTGAPPKAEAFTDIGTTYLGPDVGIKRWPACRGTHSAIVAGQRLRRRGISPSDIADVSVQVSPPNDMLFVPRDQRIRPQTPIDAKFSIPFVLALALQGDEITLESFSNQNLASGILRDLAAKVRMEESLAPPHLEAVFHFHLMTGDVIAEPIEPLEAWRAGDTTLDGLILKIEACLAVGSVPVPLDLFLSALGDLADTGIGPLMQILRTGTAAN